MSPNLLESPRRVRYVATRSEAWVIRRRRAAAFAGRATWFVLLQGGMLLLGFMGSAGAGRFLFTVFALLMTLIIGASAATVFLRSVIFPDRRVFEIPRWSIPPSGASTFSL